MPSLWSLFKSLDEVMLTSVQSLTEDLMLVYHTQAFDASQHLSLVCFHSSKAVMQNRASEVSKACPILIF
eukprot:5784182-Amphidinium_carterae.1